jgi:hypothetical protein
MATAMWSARLAWGEADGRIQDHLSLSIGFPRGLHREADGEFDGGLDSRLGNERLRRIHAGTFMINRLPRVLLQHGEARPVNLALRLAPDSRRFDLSAARRRQSPTSGGGRVAPQSDPYSCRGPQPRWSTCGRE